MIAVFPLLCSNSVNSSAIPGICKTLERFIMINNLDEILTNTKVDFMKSRGRIIIKENMSLLNSNEFFYDEDLDIEKLCQENNVIYNKETNSIEVEVLFEGLKNLQSLQDEIEEYEKMKRQKEEEIKRAATSSANTANLETQKKELEEIKRDLQQKEREYELKLKDYELRNKDHDLKVKDHGLRKGVAKVDALNKQEELKLKKKQIVDASAKVSIQMDGLSLEPSYMEVDRFINGTRVKDLIGIKVIPFIVSSDEKLVNLLLYDKHLTEFQSKMVSLGRTVKKIISNIYHKFMSKIPILRRLVQKGSIKGDAYHDVVMSKSKFNEVTIVVNRLDLDDDFFESTGGINKLFKLGWKGIITMDDSTRTAAFCMKDFSGVCHPIQYTYIFSSIGKDLGKVYEDLTDVKKSVGGLFRRTVQRKQLFKENFIHNYKPKDYTLPILAEAERIIILTEKDEEKRNKFLEIISRVRNLIKIGKSNKIDKVINFSKQNSKIKNTNQARAIAEKMNPAFKPAYRLVKNELKSEIKNKDALETASIILAMHSIKDYAKNETSQLKYTKRIVKKFHDFMINLKEKYKNVYKDTDFLIGLVFFLAITIFSIYLVISIFVLRPDILIAVLSGIYYLAMWAITSIYAIFTVVIPNFIDSIRDTTIGFYDLLVSIKETLGLGSVDVEKVVDLGKEAAEIAKSTQ